jgi:phage/plasmid-associated DNA primase
MIKKFGDGCMSKYKTRGLYVDAFEFPIFCRVECACNNKPVLSSCDGGVGRRIRVVDYPVKFILNPDVNNPYQALLNPEMNIIFKSNSIRNTYIRLLIDYFMNVSSKQKTELIPDKIKDDSIDYIEDSNPVLGFIMDKFTITNNTKDRIRTSEIFTEFKLKSGDLKMTSAKFKENMLVISGIEYKKSDGNVYFTGLKAKDEFLSN